ncbi:TPA: hypothetical protein U0K44_000734 [Streptococcus suis]|nr:hypothetical protein [Streptococcus suis]HEL9633916.1 hypothetical protein [Streptococcus suis]
MMGIILTSILVSFTVSFLMMKWHIHNINKLINKFCEGYFETENSNIKHFAEIVLKKIENL